MAGGAAHTMVAGALVAAALAGACSAKPAPVDPAAPPACEGIDALIADLDARATDGYLWDVLDTAERAARACPDDPARRAAIARARADLWLDRARPASTPEQQADALALYRLGVNDRLAGRLEDAMTSLMRSFELAPHPLTLVQIALVHEAGGSVADKRAASARALAVAQTWSGAEVRPVIAAAHDSSIEEVDLQPGGDALVTRDDDGTTARWSIATGRQTGTLAPGAASHAFSPDGARIAAITGEGALTVLDTASMDIVWSRSVGGGEVSLCFIGDGARIAALGGGRLSIVDASSGEVALARPTSATSVSCDATGAHLVLAGPGPSADLVRATDGELVHTLAHAPELTWEPMEYVPDPAVTAAAFSPDGAVVATAANTDGVRLWEVATGRPLARPADTAWSSAVSFSPDGSVLASIEWIDEGVCDLVGNCGPTSAVVLWDATTGGRLGAVTDLRSPQSVAFRADGAAGIVVGWTDGGLTVHDVPTGNLLRPLSAPRVGADVIAAHPVTGVVYESGISRDEATLYRLSPTGRIDLLGTPGDSLQTYVSTASLSADGHLAVGRKFGHAAVWNPEHTAGTPFGGETSWASVALSADGTLLASTEYDSTVEVWDVASGERVQTLVARGRHLAWNPSATVLAVDGALFSIDSGLAIDAGPGDAIRRLWISDDQTISVTATSLRLDGDGGWTVPLAGGALVAVSPSGARVALVSTTTLILDATTGERLAELATAGPPHWLGESRILVAGDPAEIWDIAEARLLARLHLPDREDMTWILVTADGRVDAGTRTEAPAGMYWQAGDIQLPSWVGWDHRRAVDGLRAALGPGAK